MSESGSPQGFPNITQPIAAGNGVITRPWLQLLIAIWNRTGAATGGTIVPPGIVADFAGPVGAIPPGWLACGQAVSRTTYANLFAAITTTWGLGNGTSTFDLPPQNVFSKGVGSDSVGSTGGSSSFLIGVANLPAHNHAVDDPGHTHGINDPGHAHPSVVADSINTTGTATGATQAGNTGTATTGIVIDNATTGITTENTGSGTPVSSLPPYATFLKIIKI